jgi:hypothetical protein
VLLTDYNTGIRCYKEQEAVGILETGYYSVEILLRLTSVLHVCLRGKNFTSCEFEPAIPMLSAGYLLRLCQACFSLPRSLPLKDFGLAMLKSRATRAQLRAGGAKAGLLSHCPGFLWPFLTIGQDAIYLQRDERCRQFR